MAGTDTPAIAGEIDLRSLGLEDLRREWRRLYHSEPPRISRDLFVLALGYRLQEIAHGGLGKATRRKLQTMAKALRTTGRVGPAPSLSLKPGARLVREWRGRTHTVTVTEDGFEYGGTNYPSLTKIAKTITGAQWSGPRFFGLLAAGAEPPSHGGFRRAGSPCGRPAPPPNRARFPFATRCRDAPLKPREAPSLSVKKMPRRCRRNTPRLFLRQASKPPRERWTFICPELH
ncbi:MAG TPA: DUF2924 domain-containing protein [Methylocella sp.]|jgi:hypothetical protein